MFLVKYISSRFYFRVVVYTPISAYNAFRFVFTPICFVKVICIYLCILACNTIYISGDVCVVNTHAMGFTRGAGTTNLAGTPEFTPSPGIYCDSCC